MYLEGQEITRFILIINLRTAGIDVFRGLSPFHIITYDFKVAKWGSEVAFIIYIYNIREKICQGYRSEVVMMLVKTIVWAAYDHRIKIEWQ